MQSQQEFATLETDRVRAVLEGAVLRITFANPDFRNAIEPPISRSIARAMRLADESPGVRAVVLAGEGEHFCAGGNLRDLQAMQSASRAELFERITALNELIRAIRQCGKPVVAAVEGHAAGAGFTLALCCDFVIAADNAVFTLAYTSIGQSPDGGSTWFLTRMLPPQLAAEAVMLAAPLSAARLHAAGCVNEITPRGMAIATAGQWAARLAARPTAALGRVKRLLGESSTATLDAQLERERACFVESLHGPESREGIGAFLEKRKPDFGAAG